MSLFRATARIHWIPAFAGMTTKLLLQLNHDLVERLLADIVGGLDAAFLGEEDLARHDVALGIVLVDALGRRMGLDRHAVAGDLDQDVVEMMLVQLAALPRLEEP